MTDRQLADFLQDILDAIADVETFTIGIEFDDFQANREKILAVVKSIEIIGEAVKKFPDDLRVQHPQVPWKAIAGMRDILVHEYWGIDVNIVWATVQEQIQPMKAVIIEIIETLSEDE